MQSFFEYSTEVAEAIKNKQPVLALESTLITHGLPFPQNQDIAMAVEQITREQGVTPATIAIMNGKIKIGLSSEELAVLVNDQQAVKASRRDLAFVLSQRLNAGTTVAATLFCAAKAGIKVFATGGIGGVHRGDDLDISADLIELARIPMAVVCAGAKAILDLPRTLEFLETYSIPVMGYRTNRFPAFYTPTTSYTLSTQANEISELVTMLNIHWQLGMSSGVLIANPIPEHAAIPAHEIEPIILEALLQAEERDIRGKAITPFLLAEVAKTTQGKSMQANLSLIKHNVKVGAELAYALSCGV